jgi:hypothetical protein
LKKPQILKKLEHDAGSGHVLPLWHVTAEIKRQRARARAEGRRLNPGEALTEEWYKSEMSK